MKIELNQENIAELKKTIFLCATKNLKICQKKLCKF